MLEPPTPRVWPKSPSPTPSGPAPPPPPARRHFSTFPEPLSQSPTAFTHRPPLPHPQGLSVFQGLTSSRLPSPQTPLSLFISTSPQPPVSLLSSVPAPFPSPKDRRHRSPEQADLHWALNHGHPTTPCLLLTSPTDGELTSWPHHSAFGTSNPPPPTATSFCSPRAAHPTLLIR